MKALFIALASLMLSITAVAESIHPQSIQPLKDSVMEYNFGFQRVHSMTYADFILTAADNHATEIHGLSIQGIDFDLQTNCPRLLPAKNKCTLRVLFRPYTEGRKYGRMIVNLKEDNFIVNLIGWANR